MLRRRSARTKAARANSSSGASWKLRVESAALEGSGSADGRIGAGGSEACSSLLGVAILFFFFFFFPFPSFLLDWSKISCRTAPTLSSANSPRAGVCRRGPAADCQTQTAGPAVGKSVWQEIYLPGGLHPSHVAGGLQNQAGAAVSAEQLGEVDRVYLVRDGRIWRVSASNVRAHCRTRDGSSSRHPWITPNHSLLLVATETGHRREKRCFTPMGLQGPARGRSWGRRAGPKRK